MTKPPPQDVPEVFNLSTSLDDQVHALEQALSIQISKRIESDAHRTSLISTENDFRDLKDILKSFILEVDGLDGDESELMMERKDVLWFLKELDQRINDIIMKLQGIPPIHPKLEEETNVAKLQGQVSSMKEIIDDLRRHGQVKHDECVESLDEKYRLKEKRYLMEIKEMQENMSDKNREISNLRVQLQRCSCVMNHKIEDASVQKEWSSIADGSPSSNAEMDSPGRNSIIQSLREDIEGKNQMIQDLNAELQRSTQQIQRLSKSEESLRIHYLEKIIRDYERKLSPNARYGTIGFYVPEVMDADDLQLRIAELTERLKDIESARIPYGGVFPLGDEQ